nr:DEAD/DEAH box helicase family protein [Enterococcus faecalis]
MDLKMQIFHYQIVILKNIQATQKKNGILTDNKLVKMSIGGKKIQNNSRFLTVEMETGTGKTYTYIKTMLELNKQYGWSKFIIVVPSIAIREGVAKTFESTSEHFKQAYGIVFVTLFITLVNLIQSKPLRVMLASM